MTTSLRIVSGKLYDPTNDIDGESRDICIENGKIVDSVATDAKKIDAQDMVIMPGGVDIHCHMAGPKVNLARKLQPEDHRLDPHPGSALTRSGTGGIVPSTFVTGYRYATLGYTTAMEAAVTPIGARHTLEELHDTPVIDKGFYVLLGNNIFYNNCYNRDVGKNSNRLLPGGSMLPRPTRRNWSTPAVMNPGRANAIPMW